MKKTTTPEVLSHSNPIFVPDGQAPDAGDPRGLVPRPERAGTDQEAVDLIHRRLEEVIESRPE